MAVGKHGSQDGCSLKECGLPRHGRKSYCRRHQANFARTGSPHPSRSPWSWETLLARVECECHKVSGCWMWPGKTDKSGYPKAFIDGRHWRLGRAVLKAKTGTLGIVALHSCDQPRCLNPGHLRWGTYAENSQDAWLRGRAKSNFKRLYGARNPKAKLSDEQASEMKRRCLLGEKAIDLAVEYGVTAETVRRRVGGVRRLRKGAIDVHPDLAGSDS